MGALALVLLGVIVLGLVAPALLRWRDSRLAEPVALGSRFLTHMGLAILGWSAVRLAGEEDALHRALAGLFGLAAVGSLLMAALFAWGLFHRSSWEDE